MAAQFQAPGFQDYGQYYEQSLRDQNTAQTAVDNANLRAARSKDNNINNLIQFSQTLADQWKAGREAKLEQEISDKKMTDFLFPESIDDQQIENEKNDLEFVNELQEPLNKGSDQSIKKNESYTISKSIRDSGGKITIEEALLDIKNKMPGFNPWMNRMLTDTTREFTDSNGNTFNLENASEYQRKVAYAQLARQFFNENDLMKYNSSLFRQYQPNLLLHSSTYLSQQKLIGEIKVSKDERERILSLNTGTDAINGEANPSAVIDGYNRTLDSTGAYINNSNVKDVMDADLIQLILDENLSDQELEAFLETPLTSGKYKGKSLEEAFPKRYGNNTGNITNEKYQGTQLGTFRQALEKARVERDNEYRTRTADAFNEKVFKMLDKTKVDGHTQEEIKELRALQHEGLLSGYKVRELDNLLNYIDGDKTAAGQSYAKSLYNEIAKRGELDPDIHEDLIKAAFDPKDWKTELANAKFQRDLRRTPAFKEMLDGMMVRVKNQWKITDPKAKLNANQTAIQNELSRIYTLNFNYLVTEVGDSPTNAATKAAELTKTHWIDKGGMVTANEPDAGEYSMAVSTIKEKDGTITAYVNSFPNFESKVFSKRIESTLDNYIKTKKKIDEQLNTIGKDKLLDSQEFLFDENEVKEWETRWGENGYNVSTKVKQLATMLKVTPLTLMNRQRQAYDLPLLPSLLNFDRSPASTRAKSEVTQNPTVNTSARFLNGHNKNGFDIASIPGGFGVAYDEISNGNPGLAALIKETLQPLGASFEDIDDIGEILELSDYNFENLASILEQSGISTRDIYKTAWKYGIKSSDGTPIRVLRPSLIG